MCVCVCVCVGKDLEITDAEFLQFRAQKIHEKRQTCWLMDKNPAPYPQGLDGRVTAQEFFRWVEPLAKIAPPSICLPFHPFLPAL